MLAVLYEHNRGSWLLVLFFASIVWVVDMFAVSSSPRPGGSWEGWVLIHALAPNFAGLLFSAGGHQPELQAWRARLPGAATVARQTLWAIWAVLGAYALVVGIGLSSRNGLPLMPLALLAAMWCGWGMGYWFGRQFRAQGWLWPFYLIGMTKLASSDAWEVAVAWLAASFGAVHAWTLGVLVAAAALLAIWRQRRAAPALTRRTSRPAGGAGRAASSASSTMRRSRLGPDRWGYFFCVLLLELLPSQRRLSPDGYLANWIPYYSCLWVVGWTLTHCRAMITPRRLLIPGDVSRRTIPAALFESSMTSTALHAALLSLLMLAAEVWLHGLDVRTAVLLWIASQTLVGLSIASTVALCPRTQASTFAATCVALAAAFGWLRIADGVGTFDPDALPTAAFMMLLLVFGTACLAALLVRGSRRAWMKADLYLMTEEASKASARRSQERFVHALPSRRRERS